MEHTPSNQFMNSANPRETLARGGTFRSCRAVIVMVPVSYTHLELKRMAMARLGKQVVDLEHVSVRFDGEDGPGRTVLDDVDWIIGPGDRYGIVGANGAGKTTLLRVIQGLQLSLIHI